MQHIGSGNSDLQKKKHAQRATVAQSANTACKTRCRRHLDRRPKWNPDLTKQFSLLPALWAMTNVPPTTPYQTGGSSAKMRSGRPSPSISAADTRRRCCPPAFVDPVLRRDQAVKLTGGMLSVLGWMLKLITSAVRLTRRLRVKGRRSIFPRVRHTLTSQYGRA
jgi:hypothetical protein